MANTYALRFRFDSYEYSGQYYFVDEGYSTPSDVLRHVAADHFIALGDPEVPVAQYFLDVLETGNTVSKDTYDTADVTTRCKVFADPYYYRFTFTTDEDKYMLSQNPTKDEISAISEKIENGDDGENH